MCNGTLCMHRLLKSLFAATALAGFVAGAHAADAPTPPGRRNVILFVADGLRGGSVNPKLTPTLNRIKTRGVWFKNSHSIFPTFTTANASTMATGHYLGDTGDFSNTIYSGYPVSVSNGTETPFLENDQVLGDVDDHFMGVVKGNHGTPIDVGYLDEETVMAAARAAGYHTATVGKLGPAAIFDHSNSALVKSTRDMRGVLTIIVDDSTGSAAGIPLDPAFAAALTAAGVPVIAPSRGANGASGTNVTPGTVVPNLVQQDFFVQVTSDVILPQFAKDGVPFAMVFWSRDPDGTQHNQGDSLNQLVPGINGPTSRSAIANADDDLSRLMAALDRLGLSANTDVLITADHGFSTISKNSGPLFSQSRTSYAATQTYQAFRTANGATQLVQEVQPGYLPPGFLAIDLAQALGAPLVDPDSAPATAPRPITPASYPPVDPTQPPAADGSRRQRPANGGGLIGTDPNNPDVVIAANGGSDLVYLPNPATAAMLAPKVVKFLLQQDYTSGVFVDDKLGPFAGTLPLSAINLEGKAITPVPTLAVNFASTSTLGQGCPEKTLEQCGVEIADSGLQQGQGMHGNFSRADTFNFMAAIGPDFKRKFEDPAPASNADVGKTIATLLQLNIPSNGALIGRSLSEAFKNGDIPEFSQSYMRSPPAAGGTRTVVRTQSVGTVKYFDAAGFPGRTLGLD